MKFIFRMSSWHDERNSRSHHRKDKATKKNELKSRQRICSGPWGNFCQLHAPRNSLPPTLNLDRLKKLLHNRKSKVNTKIIRLRLMNKKHGKATATLLLLPVPILMEMTLLISMQVWIPVKSIPTLFCQVAGRCHNWGDLKRILW